MVQCQPLADWGGDEWTAETWKHVDSLLQAALELDLSQRATFVKDLRSNDPVICELLVKLLSLELRASELFPDDALSYAEPFLPEAEDEPVSSMIGQRAGPYRLTREIGRGGMSVVYQAERDDGEFTKTVAVKLVDPDLDGEHFLRRFKRELQILAPLEHSGIARLLDGGRTDQSVPYLVMEYVDGEPIDTFCTRTELAAERRLGLFLDVCEAVAYAHQHHIVHRDLKPTNILVTPESKVKLLDFGIAKVIGAPSEPPATETLTRHRMMTPAYASPEQARGATVDHRSDIFALGVVFHEVLTGERPFKDSRVDLLCAVTHFPTPGLDLRAFGAVGEDLQRILEKCLEKDPEDRYHSVRDLMVDLHTVRRKLELATVGPSAAHERLAPPPGASSPGTAVAPGQPQRPERRARALVSAIGIRSTRTWILAVAILAFSVAAGVDCPRPPTHAPPLPVDNRPRIAVLYFENNTGDPKRNSLCKALTYMLVTDLSQSPNVHILSTDRLYQILRDIGKLDEPVVSSDTVSEVAERANLDKVVLGSFVKVGEVIRLTVTLQDVRNRETVNTHREDAVGDDNLLFAVDRLTRRIKDSLGLPQSTRDDHNLQDITTAFPEAYRHYSEGMTLHDQYKEADALKLFQQAVNVDPNFAMAIAMLSRVHVSLQNINEAEKYAYRALMLRDRLSERERLYVEGMYYSFSPRTILKSVALRAGVEEERLVVGHEVLVEVEARAGGNLDRRVDPVDPGGDLVEVGAAGAVLVIMRGSPGVL